MEPFRDNEDLAEALGSLRPTPRPAFAAELDERAAAGFPRRRSRVDGSPLGDIVARLATLTPRRILVPAGATVLAAIVAATAVLALSEQGRDSGAPPQAQTLAQARGSEGLHGDLRPQSKAGARLFNAFAGRAGHPPRILDRNSAYSAEGAAGAGSSGAGGASTATSASSAAAAAPLHEASAPLHRVQRAGSALAGHPPGTGPYAAKAPHRDVERSAQIVLGSDPAAVRKDAARVFEAVHANHGIVLNSSIRDGEEGEAGAWFDLLIPSARLGDALAAFSAVAEVRSRHEASADITAPTVSTGERLRDSRARVEGLLDQLAGADSDAERAAAEAELRAERRHAAALRSQLSTLQRRANLSSVSLRIETGAAASSTDDSDGGWGVGDALDDAGHILAIAAGVTIVALAILAPLALIALLAWLANRARLRRARERALA